MKKRLLTVAKYAIVILVFFFIGRSLNMSFSDIADYLLHTKSLFYYSLLIFIIFLCAQALIWVKLLNYSETNLSYYRGLVIYFNSQFAKYLPGGFWNYVGRVYLTSKQGVVLNTQLLTIVYENILLVLVALMYSLVMLYLLGKVTITILLVAGLALVLLYFFYSPANHFLERMIKKVIKKFAEMRLTLPRKGFFSFMIYSLCSHFIMGIAFWMLLRSFNIYNISVLGATGLFALSWLLGFVSPLPGGIGVREGVLTYLLSLKIHNPDLAAQISIITRIWNILAEVLVFSVLNSIEFVLKRKKVLRDG